MKMKKSTWNAFARRSASLFLVIAMLITSVTLPEIDWQKGEATTVHGTLEASEPVFVWEAEHAQGFIHSTNITTEFGYNEEETLNYLKVTNTTGEGVNMLSAYASTTGATATKKIEALGLDVGSPFVGTTFKAGEYDKALYASAFGKGWFNTHPAGIGNILNGNSEKAVDYSGIAQNGEGLLHFTEEKLNDLNWRPAGYANDGGTRYAYFLVKYKADGYVPRMRVWGYGNQYGSNGFYQNNRVTDEAVNAYANTQGDSAAIASQEQVVFAERDFFMGDNNIQYQLLWVDVVIDKNGIGTELDSFALEINGADQNDFGWGDVNYLTRRDNLKGRELLIYEVAGFECENDAIAYMYNDIYEDNGKFTEKAYRTETLINAPQKMAVGDTVKAHTNNLIPGVVLNRGLYASTGLDGNGDRTGITPLENVEYVSSIYKTDPTILTAEGSMTSNHASGHVTKGNQSYLETLTYKVNSFAKTAGVKYYYGVKLGDASSIYPELAAKNKFTGDIDITTPLEIVAYENDPSLSPLPNYNTYGKEGHSYYQYDMDFAYMDAYEGDTWSIENFIYYLRAVNTPAEHLHEGDPTKITDLPGYFHTSTGSMTYDLGPAISDNYEYVDFEYNNKIGTGKEVKLTLYVTTYASVDDAKNNNAKGTKTYTQTISKEGRNVARFAIPKYETATELGQTNCGSSSYVQNFAIRVETGTNDSVHNTTFDITNIVFAKRHTVEVVFKNEVDRDQHNAWDFNNKAVGVSHQTVVGTDNCDKKAHKGVQGEPIYKNDSNGNPTDEILVDNSNNIYYNIENLACDEFCQFINFETEGENALNGNPVFGSEKVSVYAVQQSDYNFAYNIDIGTVTGIAKTDTEAGKNNKLNAEVGHINYDFSMFANTVVNIRVLWQNYADNIVAGMGLIDNKGKVEILQSEAQKEAIISDDISASTDGTEVTGSESNGDNPPVITGVSYVKDSNKPAYYADGTVTVNLDPFKGDNATDIYMYYGDVNGNPLTDYMHLQRQRVPEYAMVVEFDMVENTVIPAGAKTLVIEAKVIQNGSIKYDADGNTTGFNAPKVISTSKRYMIELSGKSVADAFGTEENPLVYSFQVVSDTHIGKTDQLPGTMSTENRFTAMLKDVAQYVNSSNQGVNHYGIVIDGDVTDDGTKDQYNSLINLYTAQRNTYGDKLPTMLWSIGNHDWNLGTDTSYLSQFYDATSSSDYVKTVSTKPYYDIPIDPNGDNPGAHFIYLGDESGDSTGGVDANISATQVNWLKTTLAENYIEGRPIFIFCHQAIYNTVAGSLAGQGWDGIINSEIEDDLERELMKVLSSYKEITYFSGHSHWDLNSVGTYHKESDVMADAFNTGSVGYLWHSYYETYHGNFYGDHYETYETVGGSQGYYVEVYKDGTILVRGRDFTDNGDGNGMWMPSAYFCVEKPKMVTENISGLHATETFQLAINKTTFEYGEQITAGANWLASTAAQGIAISTSQYPTAATIVEFNQLPGGNLESKTGDGSIDNRTHTVFNSAGTLAAGTYYLVPWHSSGNVIFPSQQTTSMCIAFTVKAKPDGYSNPKIDITLNKDKFEYGETIYVNVGNVVDDTTESWIGIYNKGAVPSGSAYGNKDYANCSREYLSPTNQDKPAIPHGVYQMNKLDNSGITFVHPTTGQNTPYYLTPGTYTVAVYGGSSSYEVLSDVIEFTVETQYYVDSAKDSYGLGEQITLNYIASGDYTNYFDGSLIDISTKDIYIAVSNDWSGSQAALINAKVDRGLGTVTFDMPENMTVGNYEVRIMAGAGWDAWCTYDNCGTFTVVEGDLDPVVEVSKEQYLNGEDISITYADIYNGTFAIYKESGTLIHEISKTGKGTVTIDCPSVYLPNGNYYVAFTHTDGTVVKDEFTVVANNFSVAVSKSTVKRGEKITITYNTTGTYSGGDNSQDVSGFSNYWIRIWENNPNSNYQYIGNIKVARGVENGTVEFVVPSNAPFTSYLVTMHAYEDSNVWLIGGSDGRNNPATLTVTDVYPTLTLDKTNASVDNGQVKFLEGDLLTVNYTGSMFPYSVSIMTADGKTVCQTAYTTANGSIKFNGSGTTTYLPPAEEHINGVHFTDAQYISLPEGNYKIVVRNADGNVITKDADAIYFTIVERKVSIKFKDADESVKSKTLAFNTPLEISYNGTSKGFFLALYQDGMSPEGKAGDQIAACGALQLAYTSTSGEITFNNYYKDPYNNRVYLLDPADVEVVSALGKENLYLGEGTYYVQAFKIYNNVITKVTDPLTVTYTVSAGNTPSIEPEIDGKYTYINNEYVGVNYTGAGWGYWMAVYNKADAQYTDDQGNVYTLAEGESLPEGAKFVEGSETNYYYPLTNQDPYKNNSSYGNNNVDVKAIMRAWINGDDDMVEMNNALNFSGTLDTGTSRELPMLPQHLNGVEYINESTIVLGHLTKVMEYTVIMFNEQNNEVSRFDIKVVPPGHKTDDDTVIDPDNPVVGYIGRWQSEAGVVVIEVKKGDKDTSVIEYSTRKKFTAKAKDGYKFVGWYELSSSGNVKSLISDNEELIYYNFYTGKITVYALFVKVGIDEETKETLDVTVFDVNFVNDAGLVMQSIPTYNGSAVDIQRLMYTPPVKIGYTFKSWNIPTAATRDVTVSYYDVSPLAEGAVASETASSTSRFYVVSGDAYAYDVVYAAKVDAKGNAIDTDDNVTVDPAAFIWEATLLINITENVTIYGKWVPAKSDGSVRGATIDYKLYDASEKNFVRDSFDANIGVNAYVDTDEMEEFTFVGWADFGKPIEQSYVIKENTSATENADVVIDSENADGAKIKIYSNGTVKVNDIYYPIVSYNRYFSFRIGGNMDLQAVYAKGTYDVKANAKPSATISLYAQYQDLSTSSSARLRTTVNAIVPVENDLTGYKIVEYGYLNFMAVSESVVPTTRFYNESGEYVDAKFLSLATVAGEDAMFAKTVINKANKAGQYYGYVSTTASTGRKLYTRPYVIYKKADTDAETANWTIAYGETLVLDLSSVAGDDAFVGDSDRVKIFDEDTLTAGTYVNYN